MPESTFNFFPPKTKTTSNPVLVPHSELLPHSALIPVISKGKKKLISDPTVLPRKAKPPVDPKDKRRKFPGALNIRPAFGPANAGAMSSFVGGVGVGPTVGGYGLSNYGARAYGEALEYAQNYYKFKNILETAEEMTEKALLEDPFGQFTVFDKSDAGMKPVTDYDAKKYEKTIIKRSIKNKKSYYNNTVLKSTNKITKEPLVEALF
jgi:hypothetical protein